MVMTTSTSEAAHTGGLYAAGADDAAALASASISFAGPAVLLAVVAAFSGFLVGCGFMGILWAVL